MYVSAIIERLCLENGLEFASFHDSGEFGGDLEAHLRERSVDFLAYINARWEDVSSLGGVPAFHVVRDPRDVLVSAYFSHLNTHQTDDWPELESHRRRLRSVNQEEGLLLEMEFSAGVFEDMVSWDYESDHVLELTFEELTGAPYRTFLRVFEHLGLLDDRAFGLRRHVGYAARGLWNQAVSLAGDRAPRIRNRRIPGGRILSVAYDNRFSRRAGGRRPGTEDRGSHYRRGEPGDWRRHLTERHLEAFRDRFPELLEATGYARRGPTLYSSRSLQA